MRILIVGAGALGCWLGAALFCGGLDVSLYHHQRQKAELIREHGLIITAADGSRRQLRIPIFAEINQAGSVDLAVVLVKSYDTESAAADISRLAGQPAILTLQNGLGNIELLSGLFAAERLFAGITYQGAREKEAGEINDSGYGRTIVAALDPAQDASAANLAAVFSAHGLKTSAVNSAELDKERWQKLLVNAAINPLSALWQLKNGELLLDKSIRRLMRQLLAEGIAVARSIGLVFEQEQIWELVVEVCRHTADNISSMRADVERGRQTEINAINGAIADLGKRNQIAVPVNEEITRRIRDLEKC